MRTRWLFAALALAMMFGSSASAQTGGRRPSGYTPYQPSKPLVSPYFDLFRQDNAPLPNYQFFFRRNQNLRSTLDRKDQQLQQLQSGQEQLRAGQREIQSNLRQLRGAPATGVGATFGTHGGYYQNHGGYFQLR